MTEPTEANVVASELTAAKLRMLSVLNSEGSNLRQIEIAAQAFALLNGTLTSTTAVMKS